MSKIPSEIDCAAGQRIRGARIAARMSQQQLGAAIGVTFQQVQKYENGSNRVGVSRLTAIAGALNVSPAHLVGAGAIEPPRTLKLLATRDGAALVEAFEHIASAELRRRVVMFAQWSADMSKLPVWRDPGPAMPKEAMS